MKSQLPLSLSLLYYLLLCTETPLLCGWQQLLYPHQAISKSCCHNDLYEPGGLENWEGNETW